MTNWWHFFLFFPENSIWPFMQIVYTGDNLHEMSNPVFWEKEEKYFSMSSAENFTQSWYWAHHMGTWCPHSCMTMQKVPYPTPLCPEMLARAVNTLTCYGYCIYPKYWDTLSIYHICPKNWNSANSVDPDQMSLYVASDLGLHCLQRPICTNT